MEGGANITPEQQTHFIRNVIEGFDELRPRLDYVAEERGAELLEARRRLVDRKSLVNQFVEQPIAEVRAVDCGREFIRLVG